MRLRIENRVSKTDIEQFGERAIDFSLESIKDQLGEVVFKDHVLIKKEKAPSGDVLLEGEFIFVSKDDVENFNSCLNVLRNSRFENPAMISVVNQLLMIL